jgi:DNA polymerase elongation subunit (family B)
MINSTCFPYSWHLDDKEQQDTILRVYALGVNNENICLRIDDFTPYVYIELPDNIKWTTSNAQLVGNKIDDICQNFKPIKKQLVFKQKLYYAHITKDKKQKLFPYLFCSFLCIKDIRTFSFKIQKPINIVGLGLIKLRMHEQDASPVLQLVCCRDIPTCGWVNFVGKLVVDNKKTLCDYEYKVKWKHIDKSNRDSIAKPLVMGWDIETNSSNPSAMPRPEKPKDKVFQISCVLWREGDPESKYRKFLLTLGSPDPDVLGKDITIYEYEIESDLLLGFTKFIRKENPNVLVGYNIFGFDIPYMIKRAKLENCIYDFDKMGFHESAHASEKIIKWSSSAYKNQEFEFLDAEGRLFVDLLPLVKRDYKMDNYKLKTISEYFIGATKDPLSYKGIFKCYRIGMKGGIKGSKALGICGKYCIQDSVLVVKLMEKLKTWVGLCEMSNVCNVQPFTLYTAGQQIKVYSQVYRYCMYKNIVVEKDGYVTKESDRYVGAHVFDPVPGVYDCVLPFDFASLYPTTIIAYNIDYSTLVMDDDVPDSDCHVMKWEDHVGCMHDPKVIRRCGLTDMINIVEEKMKKLRTKRDQIKGKGSGDKKDVVQQEINVLKESTTPWREERTNLVKGKAKFPMCEKRYYRFLKEPKGVMPTVLQGLLDARKKTRKIDMTDIKSKIKELKKDEEENEDKIKELNGTLEVLDKRQLAYKISANSMYGAMGVRRGYLPFMPGAMCTTYMGRVNIELVAETIPKKFKGDLIYGDTDCVTPTTPVLVKKDSQIEYLTVEDLSAGNWERINPNKEISTAKPGYTIWSDKGFTDIVKVVRCSVKKPLIRVVTHTGVVDCSDEHSLLRDNLECVTPSDIELGDKLCTTEFPLPEDTPSVPVYKNNLTHCTIRDYQIPETHTMKVSAALAFVWGLFYADGSCGDYVCSNGYEKYTWAINNQDVELLSRCQNILNGLYDGLTFKVLSTMESSSVNKLVPSMTVRKHNHTIPMFVTEYRSLFYDTRRNKKIPVEILNAPFDIRQAFFMGYYAGDGSKKDSAISISNKGAIGSAGLFYLMRSIGYQVSVNVRKDKRDIYKLTVSTPEKSFRYLPNAVKKLDPISPNAEEYIYDIQTGNHHFAAGVGQLVVHNSNYIHFPHLKTAQEAWDWAEHVADEVTKMFPPPIKLEFEEAIYWRFFILTKKRYMYTTCYRDGKIVQKKDSDGNELGDLVGKKGVLLARRDNSQFIRDIYEKVITMVFERTEKDKVLNFLLDEINKLCGNGFSYKNFVVTKAIGSAGDLSAVPFINEKGQQKAKVGDYTVPLLSTNPEDRDEQILKKGASNAQEYFLLCLPAQVQLAERMRRRGQRVETGSRLEYVITDNGGHSAKQYVKVECAEYFTAHSDVLKLDFMYYLKLLSNPMDQVLYVAFKEKNFVLDQYKYRLKERNKVLDDICGLVKPKLCFNE